MAWQIVCPDGVVRHFPYNNYGDAVYDATVYDRRGCQVYPSPNELERQQPPCRGTPHRVERAGGGFDETFRCLAEYGVRED